MVYVYCVSCMHGLSFTATNTDVRTSLSQPERFNVDIVEYNRLAHMHIDKGKHDMTFGRRRQKSIINESVMNQLLIDIL